MQLWVSKLNKNKWKIALIILSVALVTSCIFGVTTAWFNKVESDKMKASMDVQYVDIFVNQNEINVEEGMIPGQFIDITNPNVYVNETSGTYCVFIQVKETGGTGGKTYLMYKTIDGWNQLTNEQAQSFNFPVGEDIAYFYQVVDASQVSRLPVFGIYNPLYSQNPSVQITLELTYRDITNAWESKNPVKLQVVAAGCATKQNGLATVAEADYADVYTAFIG